MNDSALTLDELADCLGSIALRRRGRMVALLGRWTRDRWPLAPISPCDADAFVAGQEVS